jgi:hypothetical protein
MIRFFIDFFRIVADNISNDICRYFINKLTDSKIKKGDSLLLIHLKEEEFKNFVLSKEKSEYSRIRMNMEKNQAAMLIISLYEQMDDEDKIFIRSEFNARAEELKNL